MRSNNVKGHMKVHEKYIAKIQLQTNEDMSKELVMSLVDNVVEKTSEQNGNITGRNEDLSDKTHGFKRTYDDISQSSTESYSSNVEKLRKSNDRDEYRRV